MKKRKSLEQNLRVFGYAGIVLLMISPLVIASCFCYPYINEDAIEETIRTTQKSIYSYAGASFDLNSFIPVANDSQEEIELVVLNEEGLPSEEIRIEDGQLIADTESVGFLYVSMNGELESTGIPVYVYPSEKAMSEAILSQKNDNDTVRSDGKAMLSTNPLDEQIILVDAASLEEPTVEELAEVSADRGTVVFHLPKSEGLHRNYVKDYYSAGSVNLIDVVMRLAKYGIHIERESLQAIKEQGSDFLPNIWNLSKEGRILLSVSDFTWTSSDEEVIRIEDGIPVITGEGVASLTAESEEGSFTVAVEVIEPEAVTDFKKAAIQDYYIALEDEEHQLVAEHTYAWPNKANGKKGSVTIKEGLIYQYGSKYFLTTESFQADWKDLDIYSYTDHMVCLSQGLVLTEDDSTNGIIRGVLYANKDSVWVYNGDDEEPVSPLEDASDWIELTDVISTEIDDYDPGADTGPESDAPFYFESAYNPYPGTISSNCTYAVWAIANQLLGIRLPNWGDAGNWYRRAGISGYVTGQTPASNSIIVWDHHVGYVTTVSEDGTMIYIREGNFGKSYHEGWWPVADSRHGQKLYGYIYLTDDTGTAIEAKTVILEEGFHDTEEKFLEVLAEIGLEPGERTEEYDDNIPEGNIISYTTGELLAGSVVAYKVSKGAEPPEEFELDKALIGKNEAELLAWFDEKGLLKGSREELESETEEDGTVLSITGTIFHKGDKVSYTVAKKVEKTDSEPVAEPTEEPADNPEEIIEPILPSDPVEPTAETQLPADLPVTTEEPQETETPPAEVVQEPVPSADAEPTPESTPEEVPTPAPVSASEPTPEATSEADSGE